MPFISARSSYQFDADHNLVPLQGEEIGNLVVRRRGKAAVV
jgi:hypothetical protein